MTNMKSFGIILVIVSAVHGFVPIKDACFCINDYPDECAVMSGMTDKNTFITPISKDKAALYFMDKVTIQSMDKCGEASINKRFIELASGPNWSVGLGGADGMGVIHGHYDFGSFDLHGHVGGNPFTGKYGGYIGVTIPLGRK